MWGSLKETLVKRQRIQATTRLPKSGDSHPLGLLHLAGAYDRRLGSFRGCFFKSELGSYVSSLS